MAYKLLDSIRSKENLVVIDNSIIMRWLIGDGSKSDLKKSNTVLTAISLKEIVPVVPSLWVYEASNVIASYIKNESLNKEIGLQRLKMPFDICNIVKYFPDIQELTINSIKNNLSSYDTTYLSLSNYLKCPLVSLDKKLNKAVVNSGGASFEY